MAAVAGAAAQGDLADVVARAGAMAARPPSTSHRTPPPPSLAAATDHMSSSAAMGAGQIMVPCSDTAMLEAPSMVDPYLSSSSATAPRGGYWLPPQQQLAVQISQHACYGRDVAMAGAAATDVDGEEAMRISPPAAHQIMKRKNEVKKVVCIPALPPTTSSRPGGGEVIPSDLWAWRKYGQKPIKGSPYPRGYYRCSSSKGCMARKQVERSRSDPNMLVITYTAEHNHPWPMQRNVLAGYSRPHTHTSTTSCKKKNSSCRVVVDPTVSSSSSTSKNLECQQTTTDMMMEEGNNDASAAGYAACYTIGAPDEIEEGVAMMHQPIQTADHEVFAELEELDQPSSSSNPAVNANIYSRGVISYDQWHKF
ncbi:putative WRKY transcription factor 14 [Panicum miliaceum]|uniref:WRKY transcription factor 14 n=1 Tax=Panicum miliaceum TaxID=4540 RepID=A0A3L6TWP9_PANMI|nr:putative WRKY transcription factor 14 [Panicum miliaceum]